MYFFHPLIFCFGGIFMEDELKKSNVDMTRKKVFAVLCSIFLIAVTVCTVFSIYRKLTNRVHYVAQLLESDIPFASEYPFQDTQEKNKEASSSKNSGLLFRFTILKETITTYSSERSILASGFYNLYGATNRFLGRNLTEGYDRDAYRLPDGKMVFLVNYQLSEKYFDRIADFASWLDDRDVPFLSVIPITLCDDRAYRYPEGFETNYTEQYEYKLKFFDEHGISYLDTNPLLLSENPNMSDWLYKTDHHWTVQAAVRVAKAVADRMSDEFGLPVDSSLCDYRNYQSVIYEKSLLGTIGKKVTVGYMDPEDIEVLIPSFDTEFHVEIPSLDIDKTGAMEDTLLFRDALKRGFYDIGTGYDTFLYGDRALIRIENKKCDNDVRVLVVKESKADAFNPYFASAVKYLDVIDPRFFDGSIRTFVEKTEPDLVILFSAGPQDDTDTAFELR